MLSTQYNHLEDVRVKITRTHRLVKNTGTGKKKEQILNFHVHVRNFVINHKHKAAKYKAQVCFIFYLLLLLLGELL